MNLNIYYDSYFFSPQLYLLMDTRFTAIMVERPPRVCEGVPTRAWYVMTWQKEPPLDQGDPTF